MVEQFIANNFFLACASFLISTTIIVLTLFHPVLVPLFEYAGLYIRMVLTPTFSNAFSIMFIEPLLLLIIAATQSPHLKSSTSYILLLMAISTFPAVINCYYLGLNWKAAFYLTTLLLLLPFYFEFLVKNMPFYQKINLPNIMLAMLIVMGVVTKILVGFIKAPIFPDCSPFLVGLLSRVGGVNASNHIGGIILMLLPLITNRRLLVIGLLFLGITFSRGVYITLLLWGCYELACRRQKISKTSLVLVPVLCILIISMLFYFSNTNYYHPIATIFNSFLDRIIAIKAIFTDPRFSIFSHAINMTVTSNFLGVGPANFYYGYELAPLSSFAHRYSNSHNIYLTLLSENGLVFLSLFLYLCIVSLQKAYRKNRPIFVSICIFMFYGLFSGQLYEAGGGKISLYDAYYFLFLLAALESTCSTSKDTANFQEIVATTKQHWVTCINNFRTNKHKRR